MGRSESGGAGKGTRIADGVDPSSGRQVIPTLTIMLDINEGESGLDIFKTKIVKTKRKVRFVMTVIEQTTGIIVQCESVSALRSLLAEFGRTLVGGEPLAALPCLSPVVS